jgi:hypothetical protein
MQTDNCGDRRPPAFSRDDRGRRVARSLPVAYDGGPNLNGRRGSTGIDRLRVTAREPSMFLASARFAPRSI